MKLHLPKTLLVAVLAACVAPTAWAAFSGPTGANYGVDKAFNSENVAGITSDSSFTGVSGSVSIDAAGKNIKLTGTGVNTEITLGKVAAASLWLAQGKYEANANSDISAAGDLYLGGGTLQVRGSVTLDEEQDIYLGSSSFTGGWPDNYNVIKNAAILVGHWQSQNSSLVINGDVSLQEASKIALQEGGNLTLKGTLSGSHALTIGHFKGGSTQNPSTLTIAGDTTNFSGAVSLLSNTDDSTKNLILALGYNTVNLGGLSSDNSKTSIALAEGTTASTLKLNVAESASYTYKGSISSGVSLSKTGAGTQMFEGDYSLGDITVSAGKMKITGTLTLAGKLDIGADGTFEITQALVNNGSISGTISIGDLNGFATTGGVYTGGEIDGNGIGSTQYTIVGGTTKSGVTVSYNEQSYTTNESGAIDIGDATLFVINSGSEKTSIIGATVADRVSIANGAGLIIDDSIADTIKVNSGDSATFALNTTDASAVPTISSAINAGGADITIIKDAASKSSTLSLGSVNHAVGSLTISDGVTVTSAWVGASGKGFINGDVTVQGGGTLELSGQNAAGWVASGSAAQATDRITLNGSSAEKLATLKLGSHMVMEATDIYLNGNTLITCTDGADGATEVNYTKGALETFGKSIIVTGTNNVSDAALYARDKGQVDDLTLNIAENATFEQAGNVYHADQGSTITKTGAGEMTFSGDSTRMYYYKSQAGTTNFNGDTIIDKDLTAAGGVINLGKATHQIQCLDTSVADAARGTVVLKENADVTVTGSIWGVTTASIVLEKDATLKNGAATIKGLSSESGKTAILKATSTTGCVYSIGNENYTLTNGQFTLTSNVSSGYTELNNKLRNVALVNEASGVLIVKTSDADRDIASIEAKNGYVNLTNMQGVEDVTSLKIADSQKVGAHTGYNGIDSGETDFGTISVTEMLTLGTASAVNGNLLLGNATVAGGQQQVSPVAITLAAVTTDSTAISNLATVDGCLYLLQSDKPTLTLDTETMKAITAMNVGETLYIMKAGSVDWGTSGVAQIDEATVTAPTEMNAGLYFTGLEGYTVSHDATTGLVGISMSVPEPTTATLSLLALAALAARRRRK